eukprot:TRINITY_DN33643_c0_g1_i1.p1 TRINITY_DN33643_c0_g1~~TRINITY_DN33643_c0_g1_i1.p1  ORF type:complete len:1117 (+),score=166.25 TRINITY_DN33643_c0_g1_i1:166-3516(+)
MNSSRSGRSALVGESDDEEVHVSAVNPMGLPLKELQKLKGKFQDEHGNQIPLTLEQFVGALSGNQPATERDLWHGELCILFKKIDASCTDTVDWEGFTNYMLNHMPGFNVGDGACELSQSTGDAYAAGWGAGHTDMINNIIVVPDIGSGGERGGGAGNGTGSGGGVAQRRYITVGRDGFVKVWHPNLTVHRTIDVSHYRSWLSACCWMSKSRRLAVASSRFKIYFYDSTFSNTPICHVDHKDGTPLCLGYTTTSESQAPDKEILMVGDSAGCVTVYPMDDDWTSFTSASDTDGLRSKTKPIRTQYHTDWVTKVGFVTELQAMVTCSLDGEINICDVSMNRNQRKEGRDAIRLHNKGVHSWCWCPKNKVFASGGLDRHIIIWCPHTHKGMNYLQGHNAAVLEILSNEEEHQLISLSVDKVVKVWDLRICRCMQTFTDKTEYKPEDQLTCMAFDEEGPALVMCSNTMNVLPVNVKVETNRTHISLIVGALYNDDFHQVVSGDSLGTVCVWDVRTGKLDFEFRRTHHDYRLTCMTFDESKRRLFTGAEDGMVKLWNFSSGQLLRTYTMKNPSEITGLLWTCEGPNTFIVGSTWERIYVWPDSRKQNVEVQYIIEDKSGQGHEDDISCLCRFPSGQLASGGDDGYVVFWKIQDTSSASSRRYRLFDSATGTPSRPTRKKIGEQEDAKGGKRGKKAAKNSGVVGGLSLSEGKGGIAAVNSANAQRVARGSCVTGPGSDTVPPRVGVLEGIGTSSQHVNELVDRALPEFSLEDFGFEHDSGDMAVAAVEKMIYLDRKECLLSSHADRIVRVWSTKRAEFLQRLDLLSPAVPGVTSEVHSKEMDPLMAITSRATSGTSSTKDSRRESAVANMSALPGSTSGVSSDGMDCLPGAVNCDLVCGQKAAISALHTDSADNKVLFTGDVEGFVRVWDMEDFCPHSVSAARHLVRVREFRPHKQSVTHLQYFELDGQAVVMSASVDGTIVLCSMAGERIGTFSATGKNKDWRLAEGQSSWRSVPPPLDEGPRSNDEDDGWGTSHRISGKGGRAAKGNQSGVPGAGAGGGRAGQRSERPRLGARPERAHAGCGKGIFKNLKVVEQFQPDLSIADQEKQRLHRWVVRADPL